jgi:hypothetical protein
MTDDMMNLRTLVENTRLAPCWIFSIFGGRDQSEASLKPERCRYIDDQPKRAVRRHLLQYCDAVRFSPSGRVGVPRNPYSHRKTGRRRSASPQSPEKRTLDR